MLKVRLTKSALVSTVALMAITAFTMPSVSASNNGTRTMRQRLEALRIAFERRGG